MSKKAIGVALITGGAKRIGRALAISLAEYGYDIAVHYRSSRDDADSVAEEIKRHNRKVHLVNADLSNEKETSAIIEDASRTLGPLSLLVNSASMFENDDIETMTRRSWDIHMEANLRAPAKLSQDFVAQSQPGANNLILNIIDQRVWKLTPQFLSYTTTKAALLTLTKTLAQGLGPMGVRVNGIGPGPILKNARQSNEDWRKQNEATILGRGATPNDIVHAAKFLIEARAVTGQMIAVDGGQHLAWQTPDVLVNE